MTRNAHIISCSLTILYCRNNDAPALVLKLGRQRQVCHILSLPPCLTASPLFGGWDTLWENICWCTTSPKSGMPRPFPWILPLLGLATLPPSWTFVDATADIVQAQNSGNLQAKYWTYISITVPRTVFFFFVSLESKLMISFFQILYMSSTEGVNRNRLTMPILVLWFILYF